MSPTPPSVAEHIAAAAVQLRTALNTVATSTAHAREMQAEIDMLRTVLRGNLGRQLGWTWSPRERGAQHLFGRRPRYHEMLRPPHADHGSSYLLEGRTVALIEQPYGDKGRLRPEQRAAMAAWASDHGLLLTTPDFPSWWHPGWTVLCLFHRRDAQVRS